MMIYFASNFRKDCKNCRKLCKLLDETLIFKTNGFQEVQSIFLTVKNLFNCRALLVHSLIIKRYRIA